MTDLTNVQVLSDLEFDNSHPKHFYFISQLLFPRRNKMRILDLHLACFSFIVNPYLVSRIRIVELLPRPARESKVPHHKSELKITRQAITL
jgi:hypothetical protein